MKRFYVYTLSYPPELARPDGSVFYVGKGTGRRIHRHEEEARRGHDCHKCNVIRKIWRVGGQVVKAIVLETLDEQAALDHERALIAAYGRDNLCNLTDGGEGVAGIVYSAAVRAQRSKLRKLDWSNPEHRIKVKAGNKARWTDPTYREALIRERRARWADPGFRVRHRAAMESVMSTPEYRAKLSAASKRAWANPEMRAKYRATIEDRDTPEYRAKLSTTIKAALNRPEERARRSAAMKVVRAKRDAHIRAMEPEIQTLWATGEYSIHALSRKFGIAQGTVRRIVRKE